MTQASSLCQGRQDACPTLNSHLAEWWTLDFAAFRSELRKALKAEIPVKERQEWEDALAGWRGRHAALQLWFRAAGGKRVPVTSQL